MSSRALAVLLVVLVAAVTPARAERYPVDKLPPALAPWVDWVRHEVPEASCARVDAELECLWPGRLELKVSARGGEFALDLVADRTLAVPLPGGTGAWPQDVKVNERPAVVLSADGTPSTEVQAGPVRVTGRFEWARMPQSLPVDGRIALLELTVGGKRQDTPRRDDDLLWLTADGAPAHDEEADEAEAPADAEEAGEADAAEATDAPTEADSLTLLVAREVADGVPVRVTTRLVLRVAGKAREANLGHVLPGGCTPLSIDSRLPARIDGQGDLRVQLRAGTWSLALVARAEGNPQELALEARPEPWPTEEAWVWRANDELRQVTVEGLTGIDPARTALPPEWQNLPTYLVKPGDRMVLTTTRRGQPDPAPDRLALERAVWLDPDGDGYTVQDHLTGTLSRTWRLNLRPPATLGHVRLGSDQLVTADPSGAAPQPTRGVEVRAGSLGLWSESRLEERPSELPAVGWSTDVQRLQWSLHLPPGWDLLALTGADDVSRGWLDAWNLGCLILVLLGSAATGWLLGWRWAGVSLLALALGQAWDDAPYATWFAMLGAVALLRVTPEGPWRNGVRAAWLAVALAFAGVFVPFAARQVRLGLFPQVRYDGESAFFPSGSLAEILLQDTGAMATGGTGVASETAGMDKLDELTRREGGEARSPAALDPFGAATGGGGGFRGSAAAFQAGYAGDGLRLKDKGRGGGDIHGYGRIRGLGRLAEGDEGKFGDPDLDLDSKILKRDGKRVKEIDPKKVGLNALLADKKMELSALPNRLANERTSDGDEQTESDPRDPNAVIQTGPGVPDWRWESWTATWDGPVARDHVVRLWLLGPLANLTLALLRGLLWAVLALVVVARCRGALRPVRSPQASSAAVTTALAAILLAAAPARAQVPFEPSSALLDELKQRLTEAPDCAPDCVSVSRLALEVRADELTVRADVHAGDQTAWKLPGGVANWTPRTVRVDGAPTFALALREGGFLAVRLGPGRHLVEAQGPMPAGGLLTLEFASRPERVVTNAPGWVVAGVHDEGTIDAAISFTRETPRKGRDTPPATGARREAPPEPEAPPTAPAIAPAETTLPPWLEITRTLEIGIPWQVQTTVQRVSPTGSPVLVKVPLLEGEAIASTDVRTEDGHVVVSLGQDDTTASWTSTLAERRDAPLLLTAPTGVPWSETWMLRCGPVWQCESSGLTPVVHQVGGRWAPIFVPWPGESLTLSFRRPVGVEGASVTVDQADLTLTPGSRLTSARLLARVRTSQGGAQRLQLPEGAKLQGVSIDGQAVPIQQKGTSLELALRPGEHSFRVDWQADLGLAPLLQVPPVELGAALANGRVQVELPRERWVLLAGGPSWGPNVLFWSQFLVLLALAAALGRIPLSPLRSWQWMLLVPGLSLVPFGAALVAAGWFFLLAARRSSTLPAPPYVFDALQVLAVAWTALTLTVFYAAVVAGLHHPPDMQVAGLGSTPGLLRWYVWQPGTALPTPWVVSLPGWAWKLVAVLWTLWLVASLFTWLRWGFACWSEGGRWKSLRWRPPAPAADTPLEPGDGPPA